MWSIEQKKAVGAMFALSISYGLAGFTAREIQKDMGVWQQLALQSWLGCALAWALLWLTQGRILPAPISAQARNELLARAVIGRVLGSVTFIQACLYAPLGNVGWLSALPTGVLFAWLIWGERVSLREAALLAVGLVGVLLIVAPSMGSIEGFGFGELCALASALVVGFASMLGRSSVREADTWSASVWLLLTTAIVATPIAIILEGGLALPSASKVPVFMLAAILVLIGCSGSLYGYTHLKASVATAILTLEAIWAMLVGYLLYSEAPSLLGVCGGALIAWSAYAMKVKKQVCDAMVANESHPRKCG